MFITGKKNSIRLFAAVLFMSIFSVFTAFAADGLIYFSDPQAKSGEEVEVQMTVQAEGASLGDAKVYLQYPAESLEFVEGTGASGGAGTLVVNGKGNVETDSKWTYSLKFKVLFSGEFTVNISDCEVYDSAGAKLNMSHLGSSKITAEAGEAEAAGTLLKSLEITPGKLNPDFSPEQNDYEATVGLSVDHLTINAMPAESGVEVSVLNNEALKEGENLITIIVKSKDGQAQNEYRLKVLKTEGGEENLVAETESSSVESAEGVQLSCKGKTITIMEIDDSVSVPKGFREMQIKIDSQPVKGWITGESEDPEYFLVYGMNDDGELHFYRYDRVEKTIQRYFDETDNTVTYSEEEYLALQKELETANSASNNNRLLVYILCGVLFLAVCILIYLIVRLNSAGKELDALYAEMEEEKHSLDPRKSRRTRREGRHLPDKKESVQETDDEDDEDDEDADEYDPEDTGREIAGMRNRREDPADGNTRVIRKIADEPDETKILLHTQRRRASRKAIRSFNDSGDLGETTVIRRKSVKEDDLF